MIAGIETTFENLFNRAVDNPISVVVGIAALTAILIITALIITYLIIRQVAPDADDKFNMDSFRQFFVEYNEPIRELIKSTDRKSNMQEEANRINERAVAIREIEMAQRTATYQDLSSTTVKLMEGSAQAIQADLSQHYEELQNLISISFSSTETRLIDEFFKLMLQLGRMVDAVERHNDEATQRSEQSNAQIDRILNTVKLVGESIDGIVHMLTLKESKPPQASEGREVLPEVAVETSETNASNGDVITLIQNNGGTHENEKS